VSVYRGGFQTGDLPKVEMLTNIRCGRSDAPLGSKPPSYRRIPLRLFWRLIRARVAMAVGR